MKEFLPPLRRGLVRLVRDAAAGERRARLRLLGFAGLAGLCMLFLLFRHPPHESRVEPGRSEAQPPAKPEAMSEFRRMATGQEPAAVEEKEPPPSGPEAMTAVERMLQREQELREKRRARGRIEKLREAEMQGNVSAIPQDGGGPIIGSGKAGTAAYCSQSVIEAWHKRQMRPEIGAAAAQRKRCNALTTDGGRRKRCHERLDRLYNEPAPGRDCR